MYMPESPLYMYYVDLCFILVGAGFRVHVGCFIQPATK